MPIKELELQNEISKTIFHCRVKRAAFKTLVDEVQELEAKSQDPGAVVHGKRYYYSSEKFLPLNHENSPIQPFNKENYCS